MNLSLDIETYSDVELTKCGVYAYADSPNFTILLLAYAFGDEETKIVDLACGEPLLREVMDALTGESVIKTAFNAMFERTCLSRYLGIHLSPVSWQCTAAQAALNAACPPASRAPTKPASTSPEPGVASRALPVGLMRGTSPGAAMTLPEPLSTATH